MAARVPNTALVPSENTAFVLILLLAPLPEGVGEDVGVVLGWSDRERPEVEV